MRYGVWSEDGVVTVFPLAYVDEFEVPDDLVEEFTKLAKDTGVSLDDIAEWLDRAGA